MHVRATLEANVFARATAMLSSKKVGYDGETLLERGRDGEREEKIFNF